MGNILSGENTLTLEEFKQLTAGRDFVIKDCQPEACSKLYQIRIVEYIETLLAINSENAADFIDEHDLNINLDDLPNENKKITAITVGYILASCGVANVNQQSFDAALAVFNRYLPKS